MTLLLAALSSASVAGTVTVAPDSSAAYLTIQEGIDAATYGDTVLVFPGTYLEHVYMGPDADGVVLLSADGPESTVIDGEMVTLSSVIHCEQLGAETLISGFTITGGWANWMGGGIRCTYADVTIEGSVFTGNWAAQAGGGGVGAEYSSVAVRGCRFEENRGDGAGVAVFGGSAVIQDNDFIGNEANIFTGLQSGGAINISNCTFAELSGNRIRENWALDAGGVYLDWTDEVLVHDNEISGNFAAYFAGGISVHHCGGEVRRNVIADNRADDSFGAAMGLGTSDDFPFSGHLLVEDNVLFANGGEVAEAISVRWNSEGERLQCHSNHFVDATPFQVGIRGTGAPDTLDFTGNWWGTSDPVAISNRIWDHTDDPTLPWVVDFSGWCLEPDCSGSVTGIAQEVEQGTSWARLKAMYR